MTQQQMDIILNFWGPIPILLIFIGLIVCLVDLIRIHIGLVKDRKELLRAMQREHGDHQ